MFRKYPQTPGTVFFAKKSNTIKYRGQQCDIVEKVYAGIESGVARFFSLIRMDKGSDQLLTSEGIYLMKLHIAIQFWRLPQFDVFAEQYVLNRTPAQLDHIFSVYKPQILLPEKLFERVQSDIGFRKYTRSFILPLATFNLSNKLPENIKWQVFDVEEPKNWANHLCSDLPIVFDSLENIFDYSGCFVFPLSNDKVLISGPDEIKKESFDPLFSTKLAILLFCQARKYVAASNREYLEKIVDFAKSYTSQSQLFQLKEDVFAYVKER